MLFISHDLSVIRHVSDRIAVMYLGRVVETGAAAELCDATAPPLHAGAAVGHSRAPRAEGRRQRIILKGELPDPANPPSGCAFHTRCPAASMPDAPSNARPSCRGARAPPSGRRPATSTGPHDARRDRRHGFRRRRQPPSGGARIPGAVARDRAPDGRAGRAACGIRAVGAGARAALTRETWFDLASLTKVIFTTTAILRLVDEGRIALDDPLTDAIPDLRQYDLDAAERRLTFRQCLAHQTHLPAVEPLYTYGQDPADPARLRAAAGLAQRARRSIPTSTSSCSASRIERLDRRGRSPDRRSAPA